MWQRMNWKKRKMDSPKLPWITDRFLRHRQTADSRPSIAELKRLIAKKRVLMWNVAVQRARLALLRTGLEADKEKWVHRTGLSGRELVPMHFAARRKLRFESATADSCP